MFIFIFFIIVLVTQYLTNKALNISSDNSISYTYSKRDAGILALFLIGSIIAQKFVPRGKIFWIGCGVYATALLITMIILATIKSIIIRKQREEVKSIFEVLEPVIPNEFKVKDKETGEFKLKDPNKYPFKLEYEGTKVNKIIIKINPNTFKEPVAVNLCLSLNKYLPNYEWVNEFDFAARECAFVGTPLPPRVAKYNGSWLRPTEFIPIGLSGLGEVSWNLNSIKDEGRSNYVYEDGKTAKTVDTPSAPQALCVGSPLGLNTIIPTTKGYKTMETIEIGDEVFGFNGKPVKVTDVFAINNPENVYSLVFTCPYYSISVISDEEHRFPVITNIQSNINDNTFFTEKHCKDLMLGSTILGNNRNLMLIRKELVKGQPTRCIRVNSDEHIFLITDKINKKWTGGNIYPYYGVYTYNTGGGKACYINQEVETQNETN